MYTASSGPRGSCAYGQSPKMWATADANVVVTIGAMIDARTDRRRQESSKLP